MDGKCAELTRKTRRLLRYSKSNRVTYVPLLISRTMLTCQTYFLKEHGLQDSLAPSSATVALLTVRQYTTLVFLGSHCAKLKHSELSQLKRVRVTEVILPDGGGDTDRRPGSGSVRGVAAGTHHCRMAQRSSARLDLY